MNPFCNSTSHLYNLQLSSVIISAVPDSEAAVPVFHPLQFTPEDPGQQELWLPGAGDHQSCDASHSDANSGPR